VSGKSDESYKRPDPSFLFRSRAQMMVLAKVLLGDTPSTLSELARFSGSSRGTIAKEVETLVRLGYVTTVKQGSNILVKPSPNLSDRDAILTLLLHAEGPIKEISVEFYKVKGVTQLFIHGSWAERFHSNSGPVPRVIEVVAVGDASGFDARKACERVEKRLAFGSTYITDVITEEEWDNPNNRWARQVREGALVELSVVPDDITPGNPNSPDQRYAPDTPSWGETWPLKPVTLKIANWNLERVSPSQQRAIVIKKHISAVGADIWYLTETHENLGPDGEFFSCFSTEPDRPSQSGERWVGLFSRWPMTSLSAFVSDTSRCAAGHVADSPFGELVLFGGVLPWTTSWRGIPSANGQAFDAALSAQSDDWQRLSQAFPDATLIVAGDFNQDLAARHYYGSKKKRYLLENTLNKCSLTPLTAGVNDPIARDSTPYACIDHICISAGQNWIPSDTQRWPDSPAPIRKMSDHFGVSVEIMRRGESRLVPLF